MVNSYRNQRPAQRKQAALETRAALNRVEAVRLRVQGKTLREIAEALGVAVTTAARYVKDELTEVQAAGAQERQTLRDIEAARLELVLSRMLPLATAEELRIETVTEGPHGSKVITVEAYQAAIRAAEVVIKISARLSALHGLDAPVKTEHSGTVNVENLAMIRARMHARFAGN